MNNEIIVSIALGAIIYFMFEFKTKGIKGFSLWYWVKDNWFNVILTCVIYYALTYIGQISDKMTAFALGFSVNKIVDYFQDLMTKKTVS